MNQSICIEDLMNESGVKFGTSGARGLVSDMTDRVCYAYTVGFLQHLEKNENLQPGCEVAIGGDLRPSTGRIMTAVAAAVLDRGYRPLPCGHIPSPAVALVGLEQAIPAIMVTGSHIPDDRNGIKYNKATGEVLKADEVSMKAQVVELPDRFDTQGMLNALPPMPAVSQQGTERYLSRWTRAFPADFLKNKRIGLYQHSAVGRDLLKDLYEALGAEVTCLGRSETFVPVDTEAIREEDIALARDWAQEFDFDAIVSTDGDSDRPLISDETGKWLRGDVAGILCAAWCKADAVVTPVSCNTAVEKCGSFKTVHRTRIGSPYVIAGMNKALEEGATCVVGYEANGGFLTATPVTTTGSPLAPLPTRDPVIVQLAILGLSMERGCPVSELVSALPRRITASDRIQNMPTETSRKHISALMEGGTGAMEAFFSSLGPIKSTDSTDGLRITFASEEILHLRPSGNAPELRCYTEADNEDRARALLDYGLTRLADWTPVGQ